MSEGLPLPAQALTSVRMRMAAFLSRSSLLCRLGSSCLVTALICLQRFCTMALGRGEEGRGRVQRADVFRDPPPPTSGPAGAACGRAPVAVSVRRPSAPLAAPWLPGWAGRVGGRGAGPWAPPAGMELVADARIHGLPGAVRATRRRAPPSTPEDVCTRVSSWAVLTGGGALEVTVVDIPRFLDRWWPGSGPVPCPGPTLTWRGDPRPAGRCGWW